jgi:N-acetylglucosamine-6-phosphate deacetylase
MIDLQVNGYGGVDFNDDHWDPKTFEHACQSLAADGVTSFLPTIITAPHDAMRNRIARIASFLRDHPTQRSLVAGIHLEGPFISDQPGFVGAHPSQHACDANEATMQSLIDAGDGFVKLVTLAPERDPSAQLTRWLFDQQIVVAAGHTNASLEQLKRHVDAGLTLVTHFGNGCPTILPRHDNILQRLLSLADRLCFTFIADGHHVPFFALANYLNAVGHDRAIIVSDAIAATGLPAGTYSLAGQQVLVTDDGATWSANRSHLIGAATAWPRILQRLQHDLGIDPATIHALTVANPSRVLGDSLNSKSAEGN